MLANNAQQSMIIEYDKTSEVAPAFNHATHATWNLAMSIKAINNGK